MEEPAIHPAIVVVAWNRPHSLQRLLGSLSRADFSDDYSGNVTLHISIDKSSRADVQQIAARFDWPHGEKIVEAHPERMGLRKHMLHCGSLSERYGSIVLLEDDLAVAPHFYEYACSSLKSHSQDPRIAGISLYGYQVAESCSLPFHPVMDGADNYFLQLPSSWGAVFSATQWAGFVTWLHAQQATGLQVELPTYIREWSSASWKKLFAAYLIATDAYFSYPHDSLSTNFEDYGSHADSRGLYQVPLLMGPREWRFSAWEKSGSVYDVYFEIKADAIKELCPGLSEYDFEVDVYGTKPLNLVKSALVLTSRSGGEAVLEFGGAVRPAVLNAQLQLEGAELRLVPADSALGPRTSHNRNAHRFSGREKSAWLHKEDPLWPEYSLVITPGTDLSGLPATMDSILAQDYPWKEILVVLPDAEIPEALYPYHVQGQYRAILQGTHATAAKAGFEAATGKYLMWLHPGCTLAADALLQAAKLFRQLPDVQWLGGLDQKLEGKALSKEIARKRWTPGRFAAASTDTMVENLRPELMIWRRHLYADAAGAFQEGIPFFFNLMGRFFAQSELTCSTLQLVEQSSGNGWAEDLRDSRFSVIAKGFRAHFAEWSRKHYHAHVPVLWKLHRKFADYPAVLRYDAVNATWFPFDY